ncbi:MAG: adenylyl-sulfate kinase [Phycisphaerales bacterium]
MSRPGDSIASVLQPSPFRPVTAWLTGMSGAGKSTLASRAVRRLVDHGHRAVCLDGDVLREGLNANLGFGPEGRAEAVRRAGEAAMLLCGAGVFPVVALISPYAADRDCVRARHASHDFGFLEVFVDAPVAVLESRDPKGLYARARRGEIADFTGISDPYEAPRRPDLHLRTDASPEEDCVESLVGAILEASRRGR